MEYSVDHAKNIFNLIESVSRYAFPLLISLIFPIVWILLKNLMGLTNRTEEGNPNQGNFFRRLLFRVRSALSLSGDTADKIVFYGCVLLFVLSGIILKIGEYKEEVIRQKTLSLKHLYEESGYLFYDTSALRKIGYSKEELDDIIYNYPDEFLWSGKKVVCVDSNVKKNVLLINHVLLESFIREKLKQNKERV